MPIKVLPKDKGRRFRNTSRENRLEELGRVDAEKAYTSKGKRNLRQEKSRIRKELAVGGTAKTLRAGAGRLAPPAPKPPKRKQWGTKDLRKKLTEQLQQHRDKQRKAKVSPQRPGGKGPKPDKRWNKGDKFMTPLKRFKGGGRAKYNIGGRANLLEEMGRIDARRHPDRADRAEKRRVIRELNKGYNSGGVVLKGKKVGCQIK